MKSYRIEYEVIVLPEDHGYQCPPLSLTYSFLYEGKKGKEWAVGLIRKHWRPSTVNIKKITLIKETT